MKKKPIRGRDYTVRKDKLGNDVTIKKGHRLVIGRDGVGISVGPGETYKEDQHGRVHAIPIGGRAHKNSDGSITPLHYNETPAQARKRSSQPKQIPKFGPSANIRANPELRRIYESMNCKPEEEP